MPVFILNSKKGKQVDYQFPNYGKPVPFRLEASGKVDVFFALTENIQEAIKKDSLVQSVKYLNIDKMDDKISFPWAGSLGDLVSPKKWSVFIGNRGEESVAVFLEVQQIES